MLLQVKVKPRSRVSELVREADGTWLARVKATPEPEFSPVLPKTIACTLTAVPHSDGMLYFRR